MFCETSNQKLLAYVDTCRWTRSCLKRGGAEAEAEVSANIVGDMMKTRMLFVSTCSRHCIHKASHLRSDNEEAMHSKCSLLRVRVGRGAS